MSLALILQTVVAAFSGGAIYKVIDYWLRVRSQSHTESLDDARVGRELRDEMRQDLDKLQTRVDSLEQTLDTEREARLKAELHNQLLQAKIDLLIRLVNDLRAKEGLKPITSDEILPGV